MTEQEEQFLLAAFRLSAPDHIGTGIVEVRDDLGWDYQTTVDVAVILHEYGAIDTPDGGSIIFTSRGRLIAKDLAVKRQAQKSVQAINPKKLPGVGATISTPMGPKSQKLSVSTAIVTRTTAPPKPTPATVPFEGRNEIPIPEVFNLRDFDRKEISFLLAAYQQNDGARFNWHALPNELSISLHDSARRAEQLQAQGVVRIVTSDHQAEFTDPARAFLRALLVNANAADCSYWTNGQRMFVLVAALAAGPENTPFVHDNLQQYKGGDIRRELIQRGLFEVTGPNDVKTKFTPIGLEQLRSAFRRRGEAEFGSFNRREIAAIDKYLETASSLNKIQDFGEQVHSKTETWRNVCGQSTDTAPQKATSASAPAPSGDPHVAALHKIAEKLDYLKPTEKEKFLSKSFSFKRVLEVFENFNKLVQILIYLGVFILAVAALYYGVAVPFILKR